MKHLRYGPICFQNIFFMIGKLHTTAAGFKTMMSPTTPFLRGEEVPFKPDLIGKCFQNIDI